MKTKVVGSVSEFLNARAPESVGVKFERHINKYGSFYRIGAVTAIILLSGSHAFAAGSIDIEARKLYKEIVNVGKWIIIFKGAIDILKALGDGDGASAKKTFISALLTFLILLGLPYGMDKVTDIFDKVTGA